MAYEYDKKYNQPIIFGQEWNIDEGGNIVSFAEEINGLVIPKVPLLYRNLTFNNVVDAEIKTFKPNVKVIQPPPDDPDFTPSEPPVPIPSTQPGFGVYSEGIIAYNYFQWNIHPWAITSYVNEDRSPNSAGWLVAIKGDFTFFKANFYSHLHPQTNERVYAAENGITKYEWYIDGMLAKTSHRDDPYFDFGYNYIESEPTYGSRIFDVNGSGIMRRDSNPWSENFYEVACRAYNSAGYTETKLKLIVWGGYGSDGESIDINMDIYDTDPDGNPTHQLYGTLHERKGFMYYVRTTPWPPTVEKYIVSDTGEIALEFLDYAGPPQHHGADLGE